MGKADRRKRPVTTPYTKTKAGSNPIFKFNKDYGQHILKNPGISDQIVEKAWLKPTDTVVEVGPGTGNITVRALERAKKVIAFEIDPRMAAEVQKRVLGGPLHRKLEMVIGDVIKMDEIPACDALISNTPYQISSPLIFKMLSMKTPPRVAVLMFQREFAKRLVAKPGDSLFSRLSVNVQFWAKVTHVMKVGKSNFKPPPQVESDVVRIEPKLGGARPCIAFEEFDGLLRICFNRKNKTLRASFFQKDVLGLCERNYKTWCAMNNIPMDETPMDDVALTDTEMKDALPDADMDDDEASEWSGLDDTPEFFKELSAQPTTPAKTPRTPRTRAALVVRAKVTKALGQLADKRARMCEENDFLRMLIAFNEEGIHFS